MAHNLTTNISLESSLLGENYFLKIRTDKNRNTGRIESIASVHKLDGNFATHRRFQDYIEAIIYSDKRGTQKAINTQHEQALDMLDLVKSRALEFYAKAH
mgnify:CR=1 FL=1